MHLEILSVAGSGPPWKTETLVEPGRNEWRLLLTDGIVRQNLIFDGATIGINLFVPTADPAIPRCIVHLEWNEVRTPDIGRIETLLASYRAAAALIANAEKARAFDHLRHGHGIEATSLPDLDLDEPRLDRLLRKTRERMAPIVGRRNVSIFLGSGGIDSLHLHPSVDQENLALDLQSLPREIHRRKRREAVPDGERRRFGSASGLPFAALDRRATVVAADPERDPNHTPFFRGDGPSASVPIFLGQEVLGVIHVEGGGPFGEAELDALERLSKTLAFSIVKARAYEDSRRRNPREAILLVGMPQVLLEQAVTGAPVESTLFVEGETGSGKEMFARFVHYLGPRRKKPFVTLDCSAVASTLMESHLFGHVKGAFTGADEDAAGVFFEADDGTVFIDEVDNLSWDLQGKLLRVLERRTLRPVGAAAKEFIVKARIIVATNADLRERVERGLFRKDLYYRLDVLRVRIPPLRELRPAIPRIAQVLIDEASEFNRRNSVPLSPAASRTLRDFAFPGNIRQLRNAMERAVVLDRDGRIDLDDLPADMMQPASLRVIPSLPDRRQGTALLSGRVSSELLTRTLTDCGGNVSEASARLRIGRRQLYKLFKKFRIDPKGFRYGGRDSGSVP